MEGFDAAAFGVSPAEALLIDPQQRLMLEGAGEVLAALGAGAAAAADAGPLAGGDVAVVAAQSFWDYAQQTDRALPGVGEAYKATGRCFSVAAGRISFCFGLRGAPGGWGGPAEGTGLRVGGRWLQPATRRRPADVPPCSPPPPPARLQAPPSPWTLLAAAA